MFMILLGFRKSIAMCAGAVPWSDVRRLVCAARDEDARRILFDEGNERPDWVRSFEGP